MENLTKSKILTFIRFFAESLFFPFLSLFLRGKGFSTGQIGVLIGIIPVTALVCAPIYSKVFNTPFKSKMALMVMSSIEAVFVVLLLLFNNNYLLTMIFVIGISITTSSNYGLLESLLALICAENNKTYGSVRMYGSISYMIGALGAGFVADFINYELIFSIAAGLYIIVSFIFFFVKAPENKEEKKEKLSIKKILSNKQYVGYVIFYVLLIGSMQVGDDFYSMYLVSKGNPDYMYSLVMFGFIMVEIITLIILNRSGRLLIEVFFLAAGVSVIRFFIQAIPNVPTWALITSQLLRGITWGSTLYLSSQFIVKLIGFDQSTSGIILNTFCMSIFTAIFKVFGGYIIDSIGYGYFYLILACIALCSLIYFAIYYIEYKKNQFKIKNKLS